MPATPDSRIDGLTTSVAVKAPCKAATSAAITLSGEQTVDGVAVVDGDRVLVKDQADSVDNGIYIVSTGDWVRARDFDGARDAVTGTLVIVISSSGLSILYQLTTDDSPIVFGTSEIEFSVAVFNDLSALNFVQAGTGAVTRSAQTKMRERFSLEDFGAVGDGVADDTAEIILAYTAAVAAGGGVIKGRAGAIYKTSSAVTISASDIHFDLDNCTIKLSGSASYAALDFEGFGTLGHPVLDSNAAAYATSVSITTLNSLVAGGWLLFQKTAPNNGGASGVYSHITKVRTISGAGPFTCTLTTPLPIAFATADAGLDLIALQFLDNVGVTGNVTFDGSSATGVTVHGVKARFLSNSRFEGIRGESLTAGSAVYAQFGHNNIFDNCSAENCGNASYDALFYISQTASQTNNQRILNGNGFGYQLQGSTYCTGTGIIAEGVRNTARGIKLAMCLHNTLAHLQSNFSGATGVGLSIGSCHNILSGIVALANLTSEGLWFSDQYNCNNIINGIVAAGNTNYDIFVGVTDTGNTFHGVRAPVIRVENTQNTFHGVNGELLNYSSSSNTPINFYSTGSFTPAITFGANAVGVAFTVRTGTYTRIGNKIFYNFYFVLSSKGSSVGNALLTGLPFASSSAGGASCPLFVHGMEATVGATHLQAAVIDAAQAITPYKIAAGMATQLTDADFTDTSLVYVTGFYSV